MPFQKKSNGGVANAGIRRPAGAYYLKIKTSSIGFILVSPSGMIYEKSDVRIASKSLALSIRYTSTADRGPQGEMNGAVGVGRYFEFELMYPDGSICAKVGVRVAETVLVFPFDMDTLAT